MFRKKLMAAGLSALMLLSGGVLVMGEETAASSVSETAVESAAETAAEDSEVAVEEAVSVATETDSVSEAAAVSLTDAADETASNSSEPRADSSNDYESSFYYETYTVSSKTYFRAIVEIKNVSEDKNLYVSSATIDLEDKDGHLLRCINRVSVLPRIIYPGNSGYLYCERENMDGIENVSDINVTPDFVIRSTNSVLHDYPDSDISFKVGGDRKIEANGRIENDPDKDVELLDVKIIYLDDDMNVLGIGGTSIEDLPVGAKRSFGMEGLQYGDIDKIGGASRYELYVTDLSPNS